MYFAFNGLHLWFQKMIPALLPFMILSGLMVRLELTDQLASLVHPILFPVFRVKKKLTYVILTGFLCGFPMGAKVTAELYERRQINKEEAEYLLAFCNNIGPVYFISFVLPLLNRQLVLPYMIGMYLIPFVYGIVLRHTKYRNTIQFHSFDEKAIIQNERAMKQNKDNQLLHVMEQLNDSIYASLKSISILGGYMIFFNLLNIITTSLAKLMLHLTPYSMQISYGIILKKVPLLLAPILEITGGLGMLGDTLLLEPFLILPFGGLCCLAQTFYILSETDLSVTLYLKNKLFLSILTAFYYLGWYLICPHTFLQ